MLDKEGYRPNVGIILLNQRNEVFWGKRIGQHSWQFPQGGIQQGENPKDAMLRELQEEIGLLRRQNQQRPRRVAYKGQKQIWFLLRMIGQDSAINLRAFDQPEFDAWRWSSYWIALDDVIEFKRKVYELALCELAKYLSRKSSLNLLPWGTSFDQIPHNGLKSN